MVRIITAEPKKLEGHMTARLLWDILVIVGCLGVLIVMEC